ncbi:MAG: prephenate dehydratase domain-containing protein, partial [Chthoniobacterales bacterium]
PIRLAVFGALLLTQIAASASDLAFLGPKGSYSDEAATIWASRDHITGTLPLSTISSIAESVRDGRVEFGLLPFENSIGGFVGETQKLLLAADLGWRIIGDITIPISNNLLVKPGTKASDLKKVISHPEALKECAKWLKTNFPELAQEEVSSTAAAAEAVSKGDGTIAAIASPAAASVYQLQILFSNIEDDRSNATNFVVIEGAGGNFSEQNPTRLVVRIEAASGTDIFARLLDALNRLSFSLTSAASVATGSLGSHRFALILDSKKGTDLGQIQDLLRPTGAVLVGAYRPSGRGQ